VRELGEYLWQNGKIKTHPDWIESLACALVSTMIGRDRHMVNLYGELCANIFVIDIGASAVSFKTVPNKVVRMIIREVTRRLNNEMCLKGGMTYEQFKQALKDSDLEKTSAKGAGNRLSKAWKDMREKLERIQAKFVDLEGPSKFTSEGLGLFLMHQPQCIIVGDEYSKMFKGAARKDFLVDNMEDMSRLYDCEADKYVTASRGVEYPEDAYVSFVSATTYYLLNFMDDDFFIQGTGTRILWVFDDLDNRNVVDVEKEMMKLEFFWGVKEEEEDKRVFSELVGKLMAIRYLPEDMVISLDFYGSSELDRYRLEMYNSAISKIKEDLFNKDANLIGRLAQNAMKLAMVHCVGRYALEAYEEGPGYVPEGGKVVINVEDAKWAIAKMNRHLGHYRRMYEVAPNVRKGVVRDYRNDQEKLLYILDKLMNERREKPTFSRLCKWTRWKPGDLRDVLDSMVVSGQLRSVTEVVMGRDVVWYERVDEEGVVGVDRFSGQIEKPKVGS
jgi:hypothetical protein